MNSKAFEGAVIVAAITGAVVLLMGTLVYFTFAYGFVLSKLWEWHATPLGAPHLGWATCAGLMLIVRLVLPKDVQKRGKGEEAKVSESAGQIVGLLLLPWASLLMGWWLK
jgi:hypothetical protein